MVSSALRQFERVNKELWLLLSMFVIALMLMSAPVAHLTSLPIPRTRPPLGYGNDANADG